MDSLTAILLFLFIIGVSVYPYILILRLLQLACKALKKYIKKNE